MLTSSLKTKVNDLEKAVLKELRILKNAKCPEQITKIFDNSFDKVMVKLMQTNLYGNVPALPVVTVPYLGIYGLAQMVIHNQHVCQICLNPEETLDTQKSKVPLGLSWALDVEDGRATLGIQFGVAEKQILASGRLPLTAVGILNLGRNGVLSHHNVVATGSRLGAGRVADLWLGEGKPRLYWYNSGFSNSEWGSASCGSYLEL